jgi:ferritin-like metal-binding protein YciE
MSNEDNQALASSEVFQNYVKLSQPSTITLEETYQQLEFLEQKIKDSPKLKQSFRKLQEQIISEGSEIAPEIADAVLLLDLDF